MDAGVSEDDGDEDARCNPDLFKELKRLLPTAIFDDYYKHGAWKRRHLLVDLELVQAHRSLAGAPDPPPVGDIPELARLEAREAPQASRNRSPPRGRRPAALSDPLPGLKPTQPSLPPPKAVIENAYEDEMRRIRLFTEKWKLDTRRTRDVLMKLRPAQQLWVMRNYRYTSSSMGPTTQLEMFVTESKRSGDIDEFDTSTGRSTVSAYGARVADGGVKRSLSGSAGASTTSPRTRDDGASSTRAVPRTPLRVRTPPRSPPRPGSRPLPRDPQRAAPAPPRPPRSAARTPPSTAPPVGNGARNGAGSGVRAHPASAPKPSSATSKPVSTAASTPARTETKKVVTPSESKPGDLIKNLLF